MFYHQIFLYSLNWISCNLKCIKKQSWLNSRPFAPFTASLTGATRFAVENEIFTVEIAIFIAEMDSGPSITLGEPGLYNSNH